MLNDRHKMANLRVVGAAVTQQFQRIHGLKCIGFQIDHVDSLRRVLQHLFHGNVDPEVGLSGGDQHRIIVVYAVNRACSQSRYAVGSGPRMEGYTAATASISAARRSSLVPWLPRKRLLYFPEKADPARSSRRLELRTIKGRSPSSSRARESPLASSEGNDELLKSATRCGYSCRTWSISMYFQLSTSSSSLWWTKLRIQSEVMYQVRGTFT